MTENRINSSAKSKQSSKDAQLSRFKDAAREAGADMTKEEFARVIGGLAKPKLPATDEKPEKDQAGGE